MKRLVLVGVAVATLVGCRDGREKVAEQRQDLSETQRNANQNVAEAQRDAQQDVQEEREELAKAQQEQREERAENTNMPLSFTGTVTAAKEDELQVRSTTGEEWQLKLEDGTQIFQDNRPIQSTQIAEGSQIRASYRMEDGDRVADRVEVTRSTSAPAPNRQPVPAR